MTINFEKLHADTVCYSAMTRFVESMDELTNLWNLVFKRLKSGRAIDEELMAQIKTAEAKVKEARQRHEAAKDWAFTEVANEQTTVTD